MRKPRIIGVIPVRMGSARLPGKPLLKIFDKTLLEWCCRSTMNSRFLDSVIVTYPKEDLAIFNTLFSSNNFDMGYGLRNVSTTQECQCGTDRVYHAINNMWDLDPDDIVVNIQGDQPFFDALIIDEGVFRLLGSNFPIVTPATTGHLAEASDPNTVKVHIETLLPVGENNSLWPATDFTRKDGWGFKHIGMYFARWGAVQGFVQLQRSDREKKESLEQLRWLDNGIDIGVFFTDRWNTSVNTIYDYQQLDKEVHLEAIK